MSELLNWCPNNRTRKDPTCFYCGQGMCKNCRSFTSPEYCPNCKPLTNSILAPVMLALLKRWAKKFKNLPDVSYGMWLRDSAKAKDHHELFSLLTDTKTLLKEARR